MNLNQLRFTQAVAETRSFSQAALICHATQPTLSNAIAQLEQELGGKLFIRTTRKVSTTPFGEAMLPLIHAILDARNELSQAADAYHNPEHKLLRIGFSPLIDMRRLDQALEPYRRSNPDVGIFFKECFLDDLGERLRQDKIDMALVPRRPRELHSRTCFFYEEPLYYLPREGQGYAPQGTVPQRVSDLPDDPLILTGGGCGMNDVIRELFEQEDKQFESYPGQALSYHVVEEWAGLGIGAGILPKAKLSANNQTAVALLVHDNSPATFSYEWLWDITIPEKEHILEFRKYVASTASAILSGDISAGAWQSPNVSPKKSVR